MNGLLNSFVDNTVQCWGCAVFDNLFRVVSNAGAAVYEKIANICFAIFFVLFVFYILWAVWKHVNPKNPDSSDPFYVKSVVRVIINSLFALTLLGIGVGVPRFITRVTFEPVADVALVYSTAILDTAPDVVNMLISTDGNARHRSVSSKTTQHNYIIDENHNNHVSVFYKTWYRDYGSGIFMERYLWCQ